jgi:Spy/CpxP family protein refolding chaperone
MNRTTWHGAAAVWALTIFLVSSVALAQQGGGGFRRGGGFGGLGGGGVVGLVMREDVQQELQLVDEQQEKVNAVSEETRNRIQEEFRDVFSQMQDLDEEERQERLDEIRQRIEKINSDMEKRLKKVLMPHQFDRLKQISLQTRIQQMGAEALTSGELAETLGLTDAQREKLERRQAEVQEELQEKMRQLRLEARDKILAVLTPEQRAKVESLMGDQFDLAEQPGFGGRGGFNIRFGNRGGGRGGDDGDRRRGGRRGGF